MLVGLQGSGKTTAAGKLARLLRSQGERVLLVAADPYRPAAVKQLETLGEQLGVPVYSEAGVKPPDLVVHALDKAQKGGYTVLILDTAGRSQLDSALMDELTAIGKKVHPVETLLVVDSMIGQEAVNIAKGFRDAIPLTGLILTKMDGDARGGAAISIRSVTGVPIKYIGTGEAMDAIEVYDPGQPGFPHPGHGRYAGPDRKSRSCLRPEASPSRAERLLAGEFSLEDFANQLRQVRKMGPIAQILEMLPGGMGQMARQIDPKDAEKQLKMTEAIISSMTVKERRRPDVLNASRRRRIASGSGTEVQDVNRLIKQFREAQKLFKNIKKSGMRGLPRLFG